MGSVFGMEPHRLGGRMEMQGGLSGNIWGGCLGWNPIDLGTVGAFIGVLGGMFGVSVWDGTP